MTESNIMRQARLASERIARLPKAKRDYLERLVNIGAYGQSAPATTHRRGGMITWDQRMQNLRAALGREPTLNELLVAAEVHTMTELEIKQQAESWVRGMKKTGDSRFD